MLPSSINEAWSFQITPHASFYSVSAIFPTWLNHHKWQSKPYLPVYLPAHSQYLNSSTVLVLEKQAAYKALLHHIQGEILLLRTGETDGRTGGLKGRTVKASNGWGKEKRSKVGRWSVRQPLMEVKGHIQDPESSRADPVFSQTRLQCCINAAGTKDKSWGSVLMLRGEGTRGIIYWTCTEHYGGFSFSFTTYLFSLFGQSPIIWQWEHRKMYRTIISLKRVFKLGVDSREGWKRRSWGSNAGTSADCEINRWMEGKQMFMVDQTSKVHMEHTLGNLLVQHAWSERKPLYGPMNMLYDHNYVVQAIVPFF